MKRIILFRFHKKPLVCKNHLKLLRKYNPDIGIYGLYGGRPDQLKLMKRYLGHELIHIYSIAGKSDDWKWQQSDLAVRQWFIHKGRYLNFDVLHLIEWDMLLFEKLEKLYQLIPPKSLGLTGLRPLKGVKSKWYWTAEEPTKSKWLKYKSMIDKKYGLPQPILVCLGPGPVFPRSFLKKYSQIKPSLLVHDEIRLPIMANVLGFKLSNTGFYHRWFYDQEKVFFNCVNREIERNTIITELTKIKGRRVFHPYRHLWRLNETN